MREVPGKIPGGSGGSKGRVSVSTRSSELDSKTKSTVKKQNKAAESYKIKDMDKLEKGQKYRAELKARKEEDRVRQLKNAETKGKIKGAAATVGAGAVVLAAAESKKKAEADKKKATPSKSSPKKLTPDQARLASVVQNIGKIDRKKK